jgi:hypothetical protein
MVGTGVSISGGGGGGDSMGGGGEDGDCIMNGVGTAPGGGLLGSSGDWRGAGSGGASVGEGLGGGSG